MSDQDVISFVVTNAQILEAGLSASNVFTVSGGFIGSGLIDDWCLKDSAGAVKENHCRIRFIDGFFCLSDVSNATYINGSSMVIGRKTLARLNEKDVLHIGPYKIRVSFEMSADEMSSGPQTIDRLFSVDEDELNLNRFDIIESQLEIQRQIALDPLLALDELEEQDDGSVENSLIEDIKPDQEALQKAELATYLLAKDQRWQGPELLVQADSERDFDSAIFLKPQAKRSALKQAASLNTESERFVSRVNNPPQTSHLTRVEKASLVTSSVSKQAKDLSRIEKGFLSKAKSKAENFKSHSKNTLSKIKSQNWNLVTKESQMDEEVLDLLEKEMGMDFSQEAPAGEGNHLVTGPIFRGLGVNAASNDNAADLQLLSEEMGASLKAAIAGVLNIHKQVESSRYGGMNKNLQPIEDNPLRLGMTYEQTVLTMFDSNRSPVHLSAPAAIDESLKLVQHHNTAVETAISEALTHILNAFSPDVLMRRFMNYRRPGQLIHESQEEWAWNMYESYFKELASNRQQGFEKLFWEIFDQFYDKKLRDIQRES